MGCFTTYELNISDSTGGRTYFWRHDPVIMNTLETGDLSLIDGARMLYADWYDGSHVLRALKEASRLGVPVFFNFEHGHEDSELLARYAHYISVCQAVTDFAQLGDNSLGGRFKAAECRCFNGSGDDGRARVSCCHPARVGSRLRSRCGCYRWVCGGRDLLSGIRLRPAKGLGQGNTCQIRCGSGFPSVHGYRANSLPSG